MSEDDGEDGDGVGAAAAAAAPTPSMRRTLEKERRRELNIAKVVCLAGFKHCEKLSLEFFIFSNSFCVAAKKYEKVKGSNYYDH